MDSLARHCDVTVEELLAEVPRFARMRGVRQLRELAPLVNGLAGSASESVLRLRWLDAGLPRPELQVPVRRPSGALYYIDLGVRELRFGSEYDGVEWHTSPAQRRHDDVRRAWLREAEGWRLVVVGGDEVYGQQRVMGLLVTAWHEHRRSRRIVVA